MPSDAVSTSSPAKKPPKAPATTAAEQGERDERDQEHVGHCAEDVNLGEDRDLGDRRDEQQGGGLDAVAERHRCGFFGTSTATESSEPRLANGCTCTCRYTAVSVGSDRRDPADRDVVRIEIRIPRGVRPGGDEHVVLLHLDALRDPVEDQRPARPRVEHPRHAGMWGRMRRRSCSGSVSSVTFAECEKTFVTIPTSPLPLTTGAFIRTPSAEPDAITSEWANAPAGGEITAELTVR